MDPQLFVIGTLCYNIISQFVTPLIHICIRIIFGLFTKMIGYNIYTFIDKKTLCRLSNNSIISTEQEDNIKLGYVFGKIFIGYNSMKYNPNTGLIIEGWIYCTDEKYKEINSATDKTTYNDGYLRIVENLFSRNNNRCIKYEKYPTNEQSAIMDEIIEIYKRQNNCSAFIYGEPGVGKSTLARLLAKQLGITICHADIFNIPQSAFHNVYASNNESLLWVIDDVDTWFDNINKEKYQYHNDIMIYDKKTWNGFLDSINEGLLPNVILIMISNKPPSFIDEMDPSYLRPGRIHLRRQLIGDKKTD